LTVRALQPVIAGLEILGHDVDALLATAAISRGVLADPDGRVSHQAMMVFWNRASAVTGDDHLGIHLAEAAPVESFELHAYALLSSPTLRDAYRRACRYQRLIHEATDLQFEDLPRAAVLRHALPGGISVPRHPAEFLATLWLRFGNLLTGTLWKPDAVHFAHAAPRDTTEHERVFGSRVQFSSGRTAMQICDAVLDASNARSDPGLVKVLDRYALSLLGDVPSSITLGSRVRAILVESLGSECPTADTVAKRLNMSVRTLHRALRGESSGYREILEQFRRERAAALLAQRQCSIAEVGFVLGFSELSSFYRAFRRWTGKTPAEYRAAMNTPHSAR
jgi:AraC-like DNA-binding protein